MSKRAIIQFLVLVVLFAGAYFGLSRINWVSVFKIKETANSTEQKLGEVYWDLFKSTEQEIIKPSIKNKLDSLVTFVCQKNKIDRSKIKLHLLQKDEINAFTLPDNYLVVYSGLITSSENEAELLGVLCHELAHIEKNHVMKKLVKEAGLSLLISITTGNAGGQVITETAKVLSSTAYDRELEREADITSVDFLLKAGIDPEPFANFLYRLSESEKNTPKQAFWISTHPDSKERAESIVAYIKGKKIRKNSILSNSSWTKLKTDLE